jgi:hypothetical protein
MKKTLGGNLWLAAVLAGAGMAAGGCGGSSAAEDATAAVSQAMEETSDATDAADVASLLHGLNALRPQAVEGFHCDTSPDVTTVDVCGKALPATVHLEWTGCAGGGGRHGGRRPPPPAGGGSPPPAGGGTSSAPASAEGCQTPGGGPSDGIVDITYTYSAAEDCTGDVTREQAVTFEIKRTAEDGTVALLKGSSSASAVLVASGPPRQKATAADVTRTTTDASGTVIRSVRLVGEMATAFSSGTPPTRTINGSYTETLLDGSTGTVTLADVVRPPRNVCRWPTGGTLTRALSDGTSHVLAFGPECGAATLDGAAVELPERRGPGGEGGGEGRRR